MRIKFLDVDGINTRVIFAGDEKKYPLLFIQGFGITADSWMANIDPLSNEFYVIAPDIVGHGFTDPVDFKGRPPHPATVEHLFKLMDTLGIDKFCPSGSSYGALLGALMYFEAPERVDKLIINGSGSCFNSEAELASALQGTLKNARQALLAPTLESCRRRMGNTVYDVSCVPDEMLILQLTAYAQPHIVPAWEEAMKGMANIEASRPYRILERLEQLDVDTLVVWGREDPRGVYASAVEAVKRMPRARLVTFEKCGHLPYLEYPEAYNDAVREFLKS